MLRIDPGVGNASIRLGCLERRAPGDDGPSPGPLVPGNFKTRTISTRVHRSSCASRAGPAVVLLHGYGETGEHYARSPPRLARGHTCNRARSARHGPSLPPRSYRRAQAGDVAAYSTRSRSQGRSRHPRHRKHGPAYAFAPAQPDASRRSVAPRVEESVRGLAVGRNEGMGSGGRRQEHALQGTGECSHFPNSVNLNIDISHAVNSGRLSTWRWRRR